MCRRRRRQGTARAHEEKDILSGTLEGCNLVTALNCVCVYVCVGMRVHLESPKAEVVQ